MMNIYTLCAMHPEAQDKLYQEICDFGLNGDEDVTLEHLSQMKYLDAFLNESLRFMPVVPFVTRLVNKDMFLGKIMFVELFYIFFENFIDTLQMRFSFRRAQRSLWTSGTCIG